MVYTIEHLNVVGWMRDIRPELRRIQREAGQQRVARLLFIDATRLGLMVARWWCRRKSITCEQLTFRMVTVRDENGLLLRLRIAYQDLAEIQDTIVHGDIFRSFCNEYKLDDGCRFYLSKTIAMVSFSDRETLWRALLLIHVCAWRARQTNEMSPVLCLERRPWSSALQSYASRFGVRVTSAAAGMNRETLRRSIPESIVRLGRFARNTLANLRLRCRHGVTRRSRTASGVSPRIGVEYSGHFNLDHPEFYSDLFFWQRSVLSGNDLLLFFRFPHDALDEAKWSYMQREGIEGAALYPGASRVPEIPLFVPSWRVRPVTVRARLPYRVTREYHWLQKQLCVYESGFQFWKELCIQHSIKILLTWYRYDERHTIMTDAVRAVGGIAAVYQRALQVDPSPEIATRTDVMFGYAPQDATVERRSGSAIRYHVAVGYLHDHLIPLAHGEASRVRAQVRSHGAQTILAYLDEHSMSDDRWHTGHAFMRDNYSFLLEKVLTTPWFGLLLKPKCPGNLRERLGPVAPLLDQAIATGRCYLFEAGPLHNAYPPAVAALASDVAVHGHLCAGSAGFECALAGTPTLLLDREGWAASPLYRLGSLVVFQQWHTLWDAFQAHRNVAGGLPGFGDWSALMPTMDPFRDGRAAERMGAYLQWLLQGLKEGRDRETVLADAADRYTRAWGRDTITVVTPQHST